MPQLFTKLGKLSFRRKSQNEPIANLSDGPQSPLRRKLTRKRWSLRRKSRPAAPTHAAEEIEQIHHAIGQDSEKLSAALVEQQQLDELIRDEFPPAYATNDPMDPHITSAFISAQRQYLADLGRTTEEPFQVGCESLVDECHTVQILSDFASVVSAAAVVDHAQERTDSGGECPSATNACEPPSTIDRQHIERLDAAIAHLSRQVELLLLQNQQQRLQNLVVPPPSPSPRSPPAYQLYSAEYEEAKVDRYNDARRAVLDYHTNLYPRPSEPSPIPPIVPCEPTFIEPHTIVEHEPEDESAVIPCLADSDSEYSQEGDGEEYDDEGGVEDVASSACGPELQRDLYPVIFEQQPEVLETQVIHRAEESVWSGQGLRVVLSKIWVLFMNWFVCQVLLLRIPFMYQPHPSLPPNEVITRSLAVTSPKTEWPQFINCRLLEWKTTCGFSAVILPSILTLLQVSDAATNALTRGAGLACFMLSLISLLSGGALLFRHREPKDPDSWTEHAEAFSERRSGFFASMALPVASAVWSLVCFLVAMMSFVWQPVPSESDPNVDNNPLSFGERIGLTVVCGMCFVGLGGAVLSLGRRGRKARPTEVAVS